MKYNHQKLLWEMMDGNISQLKIIDYFKGEGYTENEIIREITDYEQQQSASAAMRRLPEANTPSMGNPPVRISKKAEALPAKILMIFLILLLIVLLTVVLALFLH